MSPPAPKRRRTLTALARQAQKTAAPATINLATQLRDSGSLPEDCTVEGEFLRSITATKEEVKIIAVADTVCKMKVAMAKLKAAGNDVTEAVLEHQPVRTLVAELADAAAALNTAAQQLKLACKVHDL